VRYQRGPASLENKLRELLKQGNKWQKNICMFNSHLLHIFWKLAHWSTILGFLDLNTSSNSLEQRAESPVGAVEPQLCLWLTVGISSNFISSTENKGYANYLGFLVSKEVTIIVCGTQALN
jgi:hypothetical protein